MRIACNYLKLSQFAFVWKLNVILVRKQKTVFVNVDRIFFLLKFKIREGVKIILRGGLLKSRTSPFEDTYPP